MKKIITFFLILVLCFTITACSDATIPNDTNNANDAADANSTEISPEPTKPQLFSYGVADFDALLKTMPVFVTSVKYVVQDEEYKALYPDMLQAIIQNDTSYDIKNAIVACNISGYKALYSSS